MSFEIVTFGDPVLRVRAAPVDRVTAEFKRLVDGMMDTMHQAEGVGLAAQQVGRTVSLCVIDIPLELDVEAGEVRLEGESVRLTATEYGIVSFLMNHLGRVFTIAQIYGAVWKETSFAAENTVSVHIRRIREKIEINPKEPKYLKVVWGIGYRMEKI